MGNQGMKIWKLGAFFVISLMLVAGLFSNTASALDNGTAKVLKDGKVLKVTSTFTAEEVTNLAVTYTFNTSPTIASSLTEIVVTIPDAWDPAQGTTSVVTTAPTDDVGTDRDESEDAHVIVKLGSTAIDNNTDLDGDTGVGNLTGTATWNDGNRTITIRFSYTNSEDARTAVRQLLGRKTLTVTYYNVMVQPFATRTSRTVDVADVAATTKLDESVATEATLRVSDDPSDADEDFTQTITVNRKTVGTVILPATAKAGSSTSLTITYTVTEAMDPGVIEIRLPVGWANSLPPRVFSEEPTSGTNTDDITEKNGSEGGIRTNGYVYLGLLANRLSSTAILTGTAESIALDAEGNPFNDNYSAMTLPDIANIGAATGWIIPIVVSGAVKGDRIVLNYVNATAQRSVTKTDAPAKFEIFSTALGEGAPVPDMPVSNIPEYPVAVQKTITVTPAAANAGTVMAYGQGGGGALLDFMEELKPIN